MQSKTPAKAMVKAGMDIRHKKSCKPIKKTQFANTRSNGRVANGKRMK